ncbi:ferredoxin-NADP reductase [Pseudonocardia sediminis]|uniref:Ferredoxin-NADP reductase n=1 Tax=Pseudonocardia sediminis TaxID=1397368 RepID=A0A4Q7V1T3_PSEST|nr:ferredoxin reductase [Pseudonocardia sediminis]RZT86529.1 ferredoxin-NADP reductase [Pseudonocardia sediminis]
MGAPDTTSRRTLRWQLATVTGIRDEAPGVRTFRLALQDVSAHLPGQYYVLRLTAEDGYTAQRSYSVASAPDGTATIELTVERLDDGEVSEFLHDVVVPGDILEVRGPVGGWFAWDGGSPALLVGGGSGMVPLAAMLRHARALGRPDLVRMLVSVRTPESLFYGDELTGPQVSVVHTRTAPDGATRPAGRLTIDDVAPLVRGGETAYVCGSPAFADAAAELLVEAGVAPESIRVEQFGPTG